MLAVLRGRFDRATELTREVAGLARRAGLADAVALTGTLVWSVIAERGAGAGLDAFTGTLPWLSAAERDPRARPEQGRAC